ncbi:retrotransposon protein, putative, ty1-copia subclass [Tanacetum coccineum]
MVPTKKVDKTPYEVWNGQAPKFSYLKVWGYEALVKRDTLTKPDKLEPRSIKCIIIGYPKETMGYYFYYPPENKVFVSWNAEFFENSLITQEASRSLEDLKIIQEEDTHPSINTSLHHEEDDQEINEPQSDINPIRKSFRTRRAPDRMCLHVNAEEHELGDLGEPANYKAALLDPESEKWLDAMNNDIDGAIHTFKARLVAKGFTQTYGVNYKETFSPVTDIRAIRILTAIATFYDYKIWQMDVKTTFLNGHLSKEVYMVQPEDVKSYLGRCFAMKDLGEAAYILGIKIYRDRSKRLIGLCQSAYIEKILKRYFMENSKRGTIPMQEKMKLSKSQGASTPAKKQRMQSIPYASAVGSFMYAVRCTRPNVAFAQNRTSRFQQNPGELRWTIVKNILKYLRNTKDMFLVYEGDVDRKSTKQSIFATSSIDVEYIAAFDALKKSLRKSLSLNLELSRKGLKRQKEAKTIKNRQETGKRQRVKSKSENPARNHSRISPTQSKKETKKSKVKLQVKGPLVTSVQSLKGSFEVLKIKGPMLPRVDS